MPKTVLITNPESDFGKGLAAVFRREGFDVFTPADFEKIERLDYFAETTDVWDAADCFSVKSGVKADIIEQIFRKNVLVPMANTQKFLPLLTKGETRRLFYVSSAEASINEACTARGFAYKMSKAALHQYLQMLRNEIGPQGFTFRVYDPLPSMTDSAAESAFLYITRRRGTENHDPNRDDETRLSLLDSNGRHHPW